MATLGSRIPAALQAIFTASNQGAEVDEPPADNSAFRVFEQDTGRQARPFLLSFAAAAPCIPMSIASVSRFE